MLAVALVHYPTLDKQGKVVTTSVTNFDIHDIARASRTFGVARYFIVTPVELQQQFTRRIIIHWKEGSGAEYNPSRKDALTDVEVVSDLVEAGDIIEREFGSQPLWVGTSAKPYPNSISCGALRKMIHEDGQHACLIFGTGSGLHSEVIEAVDYILDPINGPAPFNHLSVRSAVSIYLDRIQGLR